MRNQNLLFRMNWPCISKSGNGILPLILFLSLWKVSIIGELWVRKLWALLTREQMVGYYPLKKVGGLKLKSFMFACLAVYTLV